MILSTQQPNADNIPTEIRDQLALNVSLGNMSNSGHTDHRDIVGAKNIIHAPVLDGHSQVA